jgi:hypothetical protein
VKFETIFCISFLAVPMNEKKIVFITARIHPGEPNSSYLNLSPPMRKSQK